MPEFFQEVMSITSASAIPESTLNLCTLLLLYACDTPISNLYRTVNDRLLARPVCERNLKHTPQILPHWASVDLLPALAMDRLKIMTAVN
jgi:hypothetical protein